MATGLLFLLLAVGLLGVLASCAYGCLPSCAGCMSKGADDIDYFPAKMEAEECMILRMEDYPALQRLRSPQTTRAKVA
jgi:hypothetical protein